jgi:hypothetical protein
MGEGREVLRHLKMARGCRRTLTLTLTLTLSRRTGRGDRIFSDRSDLISAYEVSERWLSTLA